MPSLSAALAQAWAIDGVETLIFAVFAAGLVRGFAGFGTAMIYMPFASSVVSPVWALIAMMIFDLIGPLPNVLGAVRQSSLKDIGRLGVGALIGLPFGIYLIVRIDPEVFRWMVSLTALLLLVLLMTGWRYSRALSKGMVYGTGTLGGFLGGISGLAGPPVIMLYMASKHSINVIRANILLYLLLTDALAISVMFVSGYLTLVPVMLGLILTVPYLMANVIGGILFRPEREKTYRIFAYVLIAGSSISNLPVFG